jgi:hypothetical protein
MKAYRLARASWDVLLLADEQGRCGTLDVMQEQEKRGGRAMLALLKDRVAKLGPPTDNAALCSHVEGEIWEFRKGTVRVFWFYDEGRVVVGALAYKKQKQKAPRRHINTAKDLRDAYLGAKKAGGLEIEELTRSEEK